MKNIYLILALFFCFTGSAQDSRLFENTWYLRLMLIQGDMLFVPLDNDEVSSVPLVIDENNMVLETSVCSVGRANVEFNPNNSSFYFPEGMFLTINNCDIGENEIFEEFYFDYMFYAGYPTPQGIFAYEIIDEGDGDLTLIITSPDGEAIYGNHLLSKNDFTDSHFAIYPNPASEQLTLTSKDAHESLDIGIFSVQEKLLKNLNLRGKDNFSLDISELSTGLYFLKIQSEDGIVAVKKFFKK